MLDQLLTDVEFADLDLHPDLIKGLTAAGYTRCTPIQARSLPMLLAGHDVAGQAQTGTGKTAAFLLAAMQRLLTMDRSKFPPGKAPQSIMLAPTRELAIQIYNDAQLIGRETGLRMGLAYGGVDYDKQRRILLDGVDMIIGTPGRIIDYSKQGVINLRNQYVVVLDEADRMFDLGFIKDLRYLLRRMPHPTERLTMLFSATLSFRVNELAYEHMNVPQIVEVAPDRRTADRVEQRLYHSGADEKLSLLVGLFRHLNPDRTLVFVNTKRAASEVVDCLNANGFTANALSGDVIQRKRQKLIDEFSKGELPILVATDVAARGLHIPEVSHVVNFDLPQNAEDYVHRIGRTARAGAAGDAISLACEEYVFSLQAIEEYLGHRIPVARVTDDLLAAEIVRTRSSNRGRPRRPPPRRRR
jgi:ATP-dependent RNA helicase RhlB